MIYYAIGDVHGCAAELDRLLDLIAADASSRADGRAWRIVMLGDYVDRGPDSRGVIERAMALDADGHVVLPGNHEQLMFNALAARGDHRESRAQDWWRNGGEQTLRSYGADAGPGGELWRRLDCIPDAHCDFLLTILEDRLVYHRDDSDGLFFVHAGVRPHDRLAETAREVLLWSRHPRFMAADGALWVEGLRVVHGHTPVEAPAVHPHRVGLDTGAVYGGRLSAGVFVDGALEAVLSVARLA
ncbi:metallophosphoesterase family protein [Maricaulaceae bacterium MS644]